MKMAISRRVLTIIILAVVVFAGGLSAILINNAARAFRPFPRMTTQSHNVSGNGGNAVAVGNYLFFIGNFVDHTTLEFRQNEHNRVTYGAIYRIRLGADGRPQYDNSHIDGFDEAVVTYGAGNIERLEYLFGDQGLNTRIAGSFRPIVPMVAGFDRSAMWVFGNHLVFTSPHGRMNNVGQLQSARTDFFRVNLDGSNLTHIFTSRSNDLSRDDFTVAHAEGRTFLLVNDGGRLVRVGVSHNAGNVTEIAESVTSHAFPIVTSYTVVPTQVINGATIPGDYRRGFGGVMDFVYFTEAHDDEHNLLRGNILRRFHIRSGSAGGQVVANGGDNHSFNVLSLSSGALSFTRRPVYLPTTLAPSLYILTNGTISTNPAESPFTSLHNHQARYVFQNAGQVHFPTEGHSANRFVQLYNNQLHVFVRGNSNQFLPSNNGTTSNPSPDTTQHAPIASNVSSILDITPNFIVVQTTEGQVQTIDWTGNANDMPTSHTISGDRVEGMNITALRTFSSAGAIIADRETVVYMRTFTATTREAVTDEEGNEITSAEYETRTVPVMVDREGRTWILARLPESFR